MKVGQAPPGALLTLAGRPAIDAFPCTPFADIAPPVRSIKAITNRNVNRSLRTEKDVRVSAACEVAALLIIGSSLISAVKF